MSCDCSVISVWRRPLTDFDVLARIRNLEMELARVKDRLAYLEGRVPPPEYDGHMPGEISDEEAYGAMIYAMRPRVKDDQ